MSWYSTGTISLTNGGTTATGAGTSWIAAAARGEGLVAPDGRIYEITNIASDTSLTIAPAYLGATQSGATYRIIPSQSYIRELAAEVAALVASYASVVNTAGAGAFGDGTVTEPGLRFVSDPNTGIRRTGADAMAVVANGVDQLTLNTSGLTVADNKLTITDNTDATKKAVFEASGITTGTTRTFTLPNANTTLVGADVAQTLTNKTINLASNTLTATSAQLAAALTDETGTGSAVFSVSPALTGTPTAPTAAAATNTTQLATTAHVFAERTNTATLTGKTINLSSNTLVATSAQLAAALTDETGTGSAVFSVSPALTGTPTAPTAAAATNTTQLATTAHVFAERTNTATLTNKTLTSPTINTPVIAGGTIEGTPTAYFSGLTSNVQTQLGNVSSALATILGS